MLNAKEVEGVICRGVGQVLQKNVFSFGGIFTTAKIETLQIPECIYSKRQGKKRQKEETNLYNLVVLPLL